MKILLCAPYKLSTSPYLRVVSTDPIIGSSNVPLDKSIVVIFSVDIDETTVNDKTFIVEDSETITEEEIILNLIEQASNPDAVPIIPIADVSEWVGSDGKPFDIAEFLQSLTEDKIKIALTKKEV